MLCLRDLCVLISCGLLLIIQSSHGSEIIGGKEVKPHSMPYMALLMKGKKPECGGILIDPKWVLTAAHCHKIDQVLLGVHSIKGKEKDSRQVRKVKKSFPHPCFDTTDKVNDLMLLKLNKPVKETKTVKCLKLDTTVKEPTAGSSCLVAGWGETRTKFQDAEMSDVLRSVNVNIIDRATCNSDKHYNGTPVITKDMICAGSTGNKKADTCNGDSGGPILCNGQLVGVTSFGGEDEEEGSGADVEKCDNKKKVGVYTFLSKKHLKWIKETMKKSEI